MIRVLALTRYSRSAASSRQRFLMFSDFLAANGIQITAQPFFEESYITHLNAGDKHNYGQLFRDYARRVRALASRMKYDVIWIEKEALPFCPARLEQFLLRKAHVLLDLDDAWHLRYATGRMSDALLGGKMRRIAQNATMLAVANEGLEDWSRSQGTDPKRTALLPTGLDIQRYAVAPEPEGPFTIAWIGGPFTAPYLAGIAAPLRRLSAEGVRLMVIGETKKIPGFDGIAIEQFPWSEATETELLSRCHLGLNPLPDDEWCRFKSGYKLIQYMATGRAAVASPVGANKWVLQGGETGLFATSDTDWYDAVMRLRADPVLRRRLAANGRRRAEEVFSIDAVGSKLVTLIKTAARAPHP